MNKLTRIRWFIVVLFVGLHIFVTRFYPHLVFSPDLLFLILAYSALKTGFFRTCLTASVLGWLTDYLCGGLIGVFGFSRVIAAALLHETAKYVDLKKKGFIFFLLFSSLFLSNGIANLFFHLISKTPFSLSLLLWQPLATAVLGLLLTYWKKINIIWDVF